MGAKVTIKDVAELAGVSKSTVSRYLNHGYISLEKQQRVREAIEQTGFKSNFFAKRLKTQESKLIGIVLPRMDSVTVGKLLSGINRIFDPAGYQGILLVSHLSIEKELENIQNLQQQGVDGILVDSVGLTDRHIELAKTTSVPIVYTGQWNEAVPSIKIDDWAAGRMVGAYLRQMGHRHAVFAGVTQTDKAVGVDRRQGFVEAFCEDRPEARVDFVETGFDFLSAYNKGGSHPGARTNRRGRRDGQHQPRRPALSPRARHPGAGADLRGRLWRLRRRSCCLSGADNCGL